MWKTSISRTLIAAAALALTSQPATAEDRHIMRPVETTCGLSVLVFSRHKITSAHMEPNFTTGRCYDFTPLDRAPRRGDVVSFPHRDATQVMRLIGLPGDTVELRAGRLILNGVPVPTDAFTGDRPDCAVDTDCAGKWLIETLPGGPSYLTLDMGETRFDTTDPVVVPEGRAFVLGDNRDNAADSRIPLSAFGMGLIPFDSLQRRAEVAE